MANKINVSTSGIPEYKLDLLSYLFTLKINSIENAQRQTGGVYSVQKQINDLRNQIIFKLSQSLFINAIISIFEGNLSPDREILTISSSKIDTEKVRRYAIIISDDYSDYELAQLDECGKVYIMLKQHGK